MPSRSANYAAVPSPKLRSQGVIPLRVSLVLAFVSSFCSFAAGSTPQTFLTLNSQPGDYIGQGITQTLTSPRTEHFPSLTRRTAYRFHSTHLITVSFGISTLVLRLLTSLATESTKEHSALLFARPLARG